ncbi:MAG: hypothetical protein KA771_03860 [Spirochaetales bacterium]|nr:hypothetical protein [Spirochaetales bacterium]
MDCKELDDLVIRWEQGDELTLEERENLRLHMDQCTRCQRRFALLLPLLLGEEGSSAVTFFHPVPDIASAVMAQIQAEELEGEKQPVPMKSFKLPKGRPVILQADSGVKMHRAVRRFIPVFTLVSFLVLVGVLRIGGSDEVTVRFVLEHVDAHSVSLVGDFTDWKESRYPLRKEGDRWEIKVRLKRGKVYTYNFVIDGEQWIPDPQSPYRVEDGFGGEASLLSL